MDVILKAVAGVLLAVVLGLVIGKHNKEHALLILILACCMIAVVAMNYLRPVIDFFNRLQAIGNLDTDIIQILLRSTGIALLSEIAGNICTDAGNGALGKTLQLLATAVILWLSLPLLQKLIELIESILVNT